MESPKSTGQGIEAVAPPAPLRPRRESKKPTELYVSTNIKAITRLVREDRKKDLLGELADWKESFKGTEAGSALYFVPLNLRDSFETVHHEHARVAAALGIDLDDDDGSVGSGDDSEYREGASEDGEDGLDDDEGEDDDDDDDDSEEDEDDDVDGSPNLAPSSDGESSDEDQPRVKRVKKGEGGGD